MSSIERDILGSRNQLTFGEDGLAVDGKSCLILTERYGTPLYVLSGDRIRRNYRVFRDALAKNYSHVLVCPAYKANSHLAVCRLYEMEGAGAEVVSSTELRVALDAGVAPEKIVFNGPVKKQEDLELAISCGVGLVNADSTYEFARMQETSRKVGKRCNVGIRVNVGIEPNTHPYLATAERESKFGVWIEDAVTAYKEALGKDELNVIGIQCHIGSSLSEPGVISEMSRKIFELTATIHEQLGLRLLKIDLGGGLALSHDAALPSMSCDEYASSILTKNLAMLEKWGNPELIFEPGRAIVADSGVLLTRVQVLKRQGNVNWAIADAGMNALIRPALYGAKHQIILANPRRAEQILYSVGGPCCESGDVLGKNVALPTLHEGDLLAVLDVGAYGFTMSSNYNGQPRPAVVLVCQGDDQLIRRRETYEEMIADEIIPSNLAR